MDKIERFCEGAESILVSSKRLESLKDGSIQIDLKTNEVYRSIYDKDLSIIFQMEFNFHIPLLNQIFFMKTIELYYPKMFLWRFNGQNIECLGYVPMVKENLGIFSRYKTVENFILRLRKQLVTVMRYRQVNDYIFDNVVNPYIYATGSINNTTNLYTIEISPQDSEVEILTKSCNRATEVTKIAHLPMRFWVREINPDFYKEPVLERFNRKIPVTNDVFKYYPECIKRLAAQKKKGNYGRFLLATYLLAIHNERDAKHQLDILLDDSEREHMNEGNCKDQWRAIITKNYPPPSGKTMIEQGYCGPHCGCIYPVSYTFRKFREEFEKEEETK